MLWDYFGGDFGDGADDDYGVFAGCDYDWNMVLWYLETILVMVSLLVVLLLPLIVEFLMADTTSRKEEKHENVFFFEVVNHES